eukprot:7894183-Pyramimonas_sp.AAC.1
MRAIGTHTNALVCVPLALIPRACSKAEHNRACDTSVTECDTNVTHLALLAVAAGAGLLPGAAEFCLVEYVVVAVAVVVAAAVVVVAVVVVAAALLLLLLVPLPPRPEGLRSNGFGPDSTPPVKWI